MSGANAKPLTCAPISFNHSAAHAPLKPVCPVKSTRLSFQNALSAHTAVIVQSWKLLRQSVMVRFAGRPSTKGWISLGPATLSMELARRSKALQVGSYRGSCPSAAEPGMAVGHQLAIRLPGPPAAADSQTVRIVGFDAIDDPWDPERRSPPLIRPLSPGGFSMNFRSTVAIDDFQRAVAAGRSHGGESSRPSHVALRERRSSVCPDRQLGHAIAIGQDRTAHPGVRIAGHPLQAARPVIVCLAGIDQVSPATARRLVAMILERAARAGIDRQVRTLCRT